MNFPGTQARQYLACPTCGGRGRVMESRPLRNGSRRQRVRCTSCEHRWTHWKGPRPGHCGGAGHGVLQAPGDPLGRFEVREVLLRRDLSHAAAARGLGVSPQAVQQVRSGRTHTTEWPEIPRWRSCFRCQYWHDGCRMNVPDVEVEGEWFASDCDLYSARGR